MTDQTTTLDQAGAIKKKKPRYWLWFLGAFVLFLLVSSLLNAERPTGDLQPSRFANMVTQKDVQKIVLVSNEMRVEVTLKRDALQKVAYREELIRINDPFGIDIKGPHYKMLLASVDKFYRDYEEVTASIPREDRVDVQVQVRTDLTGMVINWVFLGFLITGIVMIIRFFVRR